MVYILGGWQSDFSQNWTREGMEIADGFSQCILRGLEATGLDPRDIDCGHVGNFVAELFASQGILGGFFGLIHPDFDGMPTARHEGACASGSLAILAAAAEIEARLRKTRPDYVAYIEQTSGLIPWPPRKASD